MNAPRIPSLAPLALAFLATVLLAPAPSRAGEDARAFMDNVLHRSSFKDM